MTSTNIYKTETTVMRLDSIAADCIAKKINLDAAYQRDVVWDKNKKANFIQSCYKGITPNPLVFKCNENDESNTITCIDGKQRITSIVEFLNGDFGFSPNNNDCTYYAKIKSKLSKDNLLPTKELNRLMNTKIPVVLYNDITYEEQIDVFHRLQNGIVLSHAQVILSKITNEEVTRKYREFCDRNKIKLSMLCNTNAKYDEHYIFVAKMLHLNKQAYVEPNIKHAEKILYGLKLLSLEKDLIPIQNLINYISGAKILGHTAIKTKKKMLSNNTFKHSFINFMFNTFKILDASDDITLKIRKVLIAVYDRVLAEDYNKKVKRSIRDMFDEEYNKVISPKISKEEEEEEEVEEVEEEEEEVEIIRRKPILSKKPVVKTIKKKYD